MRQQAQWLHRQPAGVTCPSRKAATAQSPPGMQPFCRTAHIKDIVTRGVADVSKEFVVNTETIGVMIPIFGIVFGVGVAIVAILTEYRPTISLLLARVTLPLVRSTPSFASTRRPLSKVMLLIAPPDGAGVGVGGAGFVAVGWTTTKVGVG